MEKFASIIPDRVRLSGYVNDEVKASVKIIPEKKYPFKIKNTKAEKGDKISFVLKENKKENFTEYVLDIQNISKTKGRYFDSIVLETDSKISPQITIKVVGNIMEKKEAEGKGPGGTKNG